MIEEEFHIRVCYSAFLDDEITPMYMQQKALREFALFCDKLSTHQVKLESGTIRRITFMSNLCIDIDCKISGRAEDIVAIMLTTGKIM